MPAPDDARPIPRIRPAVDADLAAINDIYNHYVLQSTCTYQEEPDSLEGRRAWFARRDAAHPVTVAELDGQIVGWGSLAPFRSRSAYRYTVENSLYVRHDLRGRGVGKALLDDLVRRARDAGHHSVIAIIDAEQPASVALHAHRGFVHVARLREAGYKLGKWLDVIYMQLIL